MNIQRIDKLNNLPKRKRVCAYARVSLEKESMIHSLSYQVSYYQRLIQSHSDWEFAGIFSDEGLTGTKANRPGFKRMLSSCREGKVDMVLVKSISRFARNTVDLLGACRELKELGIDVYFEEQRIHSLSYEGELMLSLQASIAQEESRSMSENIKWKIRKDMQEGKPPRNRALGYEIKGRVVRIIPKEAEIVKLIFRLYLEGNGEMRIARYLNEHGLKNWSGMPFRPNGIRPIITNRHYTGDLLLQKTYKENHITKKKVQNNGELPQYLVENNHEALISREDFERAQAILRERNEHFNISKETDPTYPFSGLIRCGCCGGGFRRRKCNGKAYYMCKNRINKGFEPCDSRQIPEGELERMAREVLGTKELDEAILREKVEYLEAFNGNVVDFHMIDGTVERKTWQFKSRSESWTDEMKSKAKVDGAKAHAKKGE